jgi:hypothetical protein
MVRRAAPVKYVVPGSTPVVSFGNALVAAVATLGINPSASEFTESDVLLQGTKRRLATLDSLRASDTNSLTDEQVCAVLADCWNYFSSARNPYRRWFDPLDKLMRSALTVSYYDGSACHLDLVQWATSPVWGQLRDSPAKRILLDESRAHLVNQLRYGKIKVILLNGMEVVHQVRGSKLAVLEEMREVLQFGSVSCRLFVGASGCIKFVGWSTNLQSSFGVRTELKQQLAKWISSVL